mmetsp:Transcript_25696/g.84246  ORF Transcript_25696/g.84246 Transcript_25696/m.84246 type:complete len:211 (-) Transcript_25696:936-1568(-)
MPSRACLSRTISGSADTAASISDSPIAIAGGACRPAAVAAAARTASWIVRSSRLRQRTRAKERWGFCSIAKVFGAKRLGATPWKMPSRMSGPMKKAKERQPPRSNERESWTSTRASPARLAEKARSAFGRSGESSSACPRAATSSKAAFTPRPKYGLTECTASPRSAVLRWCSRGPAYRNCGSRDVGLSMTACRLSSLMCGENIGSRSSK